MKKDRLKAYRDAYAGMLFECAGYAKVIGRDDDAAVLFKLSVDYMGWNQTQKGIDKRSEKKYDDNSAPD